MLAQQGNRELKDTAQTYLLATMKRSEVSASERIVALERGIVAKTLDLKVLTIFGQDVTFSRDPESKEGTAIINIPQYSESGSSIGEGFYELRVNEKGEAIGGHTKYSVDGILARDCSLNIEEAQALADRVFAQVLGRK